LVSGHVDGVGEVCERVRDARSWRLRYRAPAALSRYIAVKGSVAVDGVSLTVNAVNDAGFEVNLVTHTLAHTTLGDQPIGTAVNLEVDQVARYLARILETKI
ncbi:MAG: riboflavin synthase, partial [Salinisphaera sp.]|nr:riboflavin synthase [Salinisphaera sp.]